MTTVKEHGIEFEVYPVGILHDLLIVRRNPCKRTLRMLYQRMKYPYRFAREGDWHAVKNCFNGYLAEPTNLDKFIRCGSGWTELRAVRSFFRHNTIRFKSDD